MIATKVAPIEVAQVQFANNVICSEKAFKIAIRRGQVDHAIKIGEVLIPCGNEAFQ